MPLENPDQPRSRGAILIVDDEEGIRKLGAHLLESLGFSVFSAADGFQCLELFRSHRRDIVLVLLDLTMPGPDGVDTLLALRQLDPHVKVLLSSGHPKHEFAQRLLGLHATAFLPKPYDADALGQAIDSLLAT